MAKKQKTGSQRPSSRQERARQELAKERRRAQRNRVLVRSGITAVVLVLFAAVGFASWQASRPDDTDGPSNMLSGGALFRGVDGKPQIVETDAMPAGSEAVPTDTEKYAAPARIVTYLDFGCEFCKAFEDGNGKQIEQLVASGKATLEVQPVAITGDYAVRAGSAASCMAARQPESFFSMLAAMYENQPAEGATMSNGEILDIWSNAGIDVSSELSSCVRSEQYSDWIQTRTNTITSDPKVINPATGSFGTPTVFVNDVRYQPQNLGDPQEFADFVSTNSEGGDGASPSPAP